MQAHDRAAQIWPLLTYAASHRQTLTYEILGAHIGVPHFALAQLLEPIQSYCLIHELPALTAIVINQSGRPGIGFIAALDVPVEQQRIFEHHWTESHVPTPDELQDALRERPSRGTHIKERLRQLLADIDAARVTVRKLNSGAAVYVNFQTSNGWKLCVFNDSGCFDYIEIAEDPCGNELDYKDIPAGEEIERPQSADSWGILEYSEIDPQFPDEQGGPE
jgi:hypothetical protein